MSPAQEDSVLLPNPMSDSELSELKARLIASPSIIEFKDAPDFTSRMISYIFSKEVAGPNNRSLARYLFDGKGNWADYKSIVTDLITYDGLHGVRIRSKWGPVENRLPGFSEFNHPQLADTVFFPELMARAIRAQSVEPVIIQEWCLRVLTMKFDPSVDSYINPAVYLDHDFLSVYSRMISERKIVFQSVHDLVEHAVQVRASGWITASLMGEKIHQCMKTFMSRPDSDARVSRIIPYVIGKLLDDLTQSGFYHSKIRIQAIDRLLAVMLEGGMAPHPEETLVLPPPAAEDLLNQFNLCDLGAPEKEIDLAIQRLVKELRTNEPFSAQISKGR